MTDAKKVFKNTDILPVYRELIEQGREVSLTVEGCSMEPFLKGGRDRVILKRCERPLKKGDIAMYVHADAYILHRIIKVKGDELYFVGDSQTHIEGPIKRQAVFALTENVFRKGKSLKKGDFLWTVFEKVWLFLFPMRRFILNCAAKIKYRSK